jgi:tetrapyrrole methylase family protein/MazG family protein
MCEELGDIMLQIVFHSQMASEYNDFDMAEVLKRICDKLERRHPHVFGNTKVKDSSEVLVNWDTIKGKENQHPRRDSVLDGVPRALPALQKAMKLQKKAAKVGFDWKDTDPVMEKIQEEFGELKRALKKKNDLHIQEEIGDLLFSIVNLARHLNLDPERALNLTNRKFKSRFQEMEKKIKKTGKTMASLSLEELDLYWDREKLKTPNK